MRSSLEKIIYIGFYNENVSRSVKFANLLLKKNVEVIKYQLTKRERFFFLKKFKRVFHRILKERIDAIIYFSDFFSPIILFLKLLTKLKRIPLINKFDISGLYFKLDRNYNKISTFQYLKSYFYDKIELFLSDMIFFLTQAQLNHFQKRFNVKKRKCYSMYLGTNESIFYPRKKEKRFEYPIIVGYWGSYIPIHGVEYIVEAAKILKDDENIKFLMMGRGSKLDHIIRQKEKYNLSNLNILGFLPFKEFMENMSKIDISLGIFGNSKKSNWCVTNKVYEALGMGLPVITRLSSANLELFGKEQNIYFCKPADPRSLSNAIHKLAYNRVIREEIGKNGYNTFIKKCSDSVLSNELYFSIDNYLKGRNISKL